MKKHMFCSITVEENLIFSSWFITGGDIFVLVLSANVLLKVIVYRNPSADMSCLIFNMIHYHDNELSFLYATGLDRK